MKLTLSNPWRWPVAMFFGLGSYGVGGIVSQDGVQGSTTGYVLISGALVLGAVIGVVITLRKRLLLRDDYLLASTGIRTYKFRRQEVVQALCRRDRHEVALYRIAYPVLEKSDGSEVKLKFLAHHGGGEDRVDGYVMEINNWLSRPKRQVADGSVHGGRPD